MLQQLVTFFINQSAASEPVMGWLVFAGIVVLILAGIFVYHILALVISLIKSIKAPIKIRRKDRIVKEYVTPPVNKELDKYLIILKKIADDYEKKGVKL